jgi:hypothetical protein
VAEIRAPAEIKKAPGPTANAAAKLPPHMQRWFPLGQTIGRCLSYLTKAHYDSGANIRQEILAAAAGTDFDGVEAIPNVSEIAFRQPVAAGLLARTCYRGGNSPETLTRFHPRI